MDISERPAVVEEKSRIGDWELDTIKTGIGALICAVDRMLKKTVLARIDAKTAKTTGAALMSRLPGFPDLVRALTADNGKEWQGVCRSGIYREGFEGQIPFCQTLALLGARIAGHTYALVRE